MLMILSYLKMNQNFFDFSCFNPNAFLCMLSFFVLKGWMFTLLLLPPYVGLKNLIYIRKLSCFTVVENQKESYPN